MERAASEAFLQVFGPTEIIWCYFHWRKVIFSHIYIHLYMYVYICICIYIYHILHLQAIRQQLQKKGCLQDYFKSEPMQKVYRMCCSLAFVPPAEIVQWWDEVIGGYISKMKVNY